MKGYKIPNAKVHPFDLDRMQIEVHKKNTYQHTKGARPDSLKVPTAPLHEVISTICNMIKLPKSSIQNIEKQFNAVIKSTEILDENQSENDAKVNFNDFLQVLSREAFLRDALSEAQIYRLSAHRFVYEQERPLLTMQQLELVNQQRKDGVDMETAIAKLPSFSSMIEKMVMFKFKGTVHLMISYENKSVQIFDYESGESIFEFNFKLCREKRQDPKKVEKEATKHNVKNQAMDFMTFQGGDNMSNRRQSNLMVSPQLQTFNSIAAQQSPAPPSLQTTLNKKLTLRYNKAQGAMTQKPAAMEQTPLLGHQFSKSTVKGSRNNNYKAQSVFNTIQPQRQPMNQRNIHKMNSCKPMSSFQTQNTTTMDVGKRSTTSINEFSNLKVGGGNINGPSDHLTVNIPVQKNSSNTLGLPEPGRAVKISHKEPREPMSQMHSINDNKKKFQKCLLDNVVHNIIGQKDGLKVLRGARKKQETIKQRTQFDFKVLGIDEIRDEYASFNPNATTKGGKSAKTNGPSSIDIANTSQIGDEASGDSQIAKELRGTLHDKLWKSITHHRRYRPKASYLVSDNQLEFLDANGTDTNIYALACEFREWNKKVETSPYPEVRALADGAQSNAIQEAKRQKLEDTLNSLTNNKERVAIGIQNLKQNLKNGKISQQQNRKISSVRLLNKMTILNSAADKLKFIELQQEQDRENKDCTARVSYDLHDMMEADEQRKKLDVSEEPRVYKEIFPDEELDILDVLPRPKPQVSSLGIQNRGTGPSVRSFNHLEDKSETYPMAMKFFQATEDLTLCIFALVSDVVIYELRQSGVKKVFKHVMTHKIDEKDEYLPIQLDVQMSTVKSCLQVCIAAISSKLNKQESNDYALIILEIDVHNEYKVTENFDRQYPNSQIRRKATVPMVTKVLFSECGLIVASFKGYIELFDTVDFISKGKWDNATEISSNPAQQQQQQKQGADNNKQQNDRASLISRNDHQQRPFSTEGRSSGLMVYETDQNQKLTKAQQDELDWKKLMKEVISPNQKNRQRQGQTQNFFERQCKTYRGERCGSHATKKRSLYGVSKFSDNLTRCTSPNQDSQAGNLESSNKKKKNQNKDKKKGSVQVTVDCLDYSKALDLIAFGGVSGGVGVLDSTTFSFKGHFPAHQSDVSSLYFNDRELQLISMSIEGEIALWDAQKMSIIQVVRNKQYMQTNHINCTSFFADTGTLLLATTKLFRWQLHEDSKARIQIEQQSTMARDFLKQYRRGLKRQKILKNKLDVNEVVPSDDSELEQGTNDYDSDRKQIMAEERRFAENIQKDRESGDFNRTLQSTVLSAQSYIETIFKEGNLASRVAKGFRNPNNNVLPTTSTNLVNSFLVTAEFHAFTLDQDSLIRQWCLKKGNCLRSYPLEVVASPNQTATGSSVQEAFTHPKKIQTARLAPDDKSLVVAFEGGLVQIHNLYTGQILFNRHQDEQLIVDSEVASIGFFATQSNFWFACSCWEGRVVFFTKPIIQKGKEYVQSKRTKSNHKRDVVSLDITTANNVVTGSIDNVVCLWQSFSGKVQKAIMIPLQMANPYKRYIQNVRFAQKDSNEFVLIFMSDGSTFCVETMAELFLTNLEGQIEVARVARHQLVDLSQGFAVSIGENGLHGKLHRVKIIKGKGGMSSSGAQSRDDTSALNNSHNKIVMELCKEFDFVPTKLPPEKTIIKVSLQELHQLLIVSQLHGEVTMLSCKTFQKICQLNDPIWEPSFYFKYSRSIEGYRHSKTLFSENADDQTTDTDHNSA